MDSKYKARLNASYFLLAGIGSLILGWNHFYNALPENDLIPPAGVILAIGGVILFLCGAYNMWLVRRPSRVLPLLILLVFGGFSVAGHWIPSLMSAYWAYILPLYLFSLLSFKPALLLTLTYAIVFNLSSTVQLEGVERLQVLYLFWSATTIACIFIFTSRERQQHLRALVSIDSESGAYNYQQLQEDLPRELARADRENTSLAVLCFQRRNDQSRTTLKDLSDHILPQLRPFDRLYRHKDYLVALLPSANYKDSIHFCARFHRNRAPEIAVAAILPGEHDTEEEILQKSQEAIAEAVKQANDAPMYLISDFLDTTEGFHNV
ncbi:GGDEF domain-containing protein [Oceanospirillum beijerinckii]|uniref:GGDEF domain-containing protein n=1 Tax=Oceanospirillum beijerinckii TaxID=64976 RepID=UPI0003F9A105|nr:GGDEF domain-containing protein [Oceanospirillum beijerinckii]